MVAIAPLLMAGAAQGYGQAQNQIVNDHNDVAKDEMREQLRQEYENERFDRSLKANKETALLNAEVERAKYERNRNDKLQDEEVKHEREMKKHGLLESGRNSRNASSNAARLKAAEMRGSGINDTGMSTKELQKQIESNNKRIFDLKKELNNSPFAANDPNKSSLYQSEIARLESDNREKMNMLGIEPKMPEQSQSPQTQVIRNEKTGKLELVTK